MTLKNELYCKLSVYDIVLFLLKIILLEKTYLLTKLIELVIIRIVLVVVEMNLCRE